MSKMAGSPVVKDTLYGSETSYNSKLSLQSKSTFEKYAIGDPDTGEIYMGEKEFIDAIAPESEDYVSE